MKLSCPCGQTLADSTDYLSRKASLVADQDREDLAEAFLASGEDRYDLLSAHFAATLYQCGACGRLFLERDGSLHLFVPEGEPAPLLHSARGSAWRRPLLGHWRHGRGELCWPCSGAAGDRDEGWLEAISTWEELETRYRETRDRLLAAGRLRSALLTRDGAIVDRWPVA